MYTYQQVTSRKSRDSASFCDLVHGYSVITTVTHAYFCVSNMKVISRVWNLIKRKIVRKVFVKPDLFYFNIVIVTVYPFRDKNEKSYKQLWPVDPEQHVQYSRIYSPYRSPLDIYVPTRGSLAIAMITRRYASLIQLLNTHRVCSSFDPFSPVLFPQTVWNIARWMSQHWCTI